MSPDPSLSVIVGVTGDAPHLFEALWSICRQSAPSEVLVADAAGLSARAVAAVADPRVRVLGSSRASAVAARNAGLAQARGSYVAIADPAGLVADGAFARAVAALERTGSDFATGPAEQFGRERKRHWTTRAEVFATASDGLRFADHPELVLDRAPWTKVYRRSFLSAAGLSGAGADVADLGFTTRAYLAAAAVDVLDQPMCFRRKPSRGDADARWPGRPAAWVDGLIDQLRLLDEAGQRAAAELLAVHVVTEELPVWVDELGRASAKVAGRAAALVRRLAEQAGAAWLVRLPLRTRWQVALIACGAARLVPGIDNDAELLDAAAVAPLDDLPAPVSEALGLDGRPASQVFLDRFGDGETPASEKQRAADPSRLARSSRPQGSAVPAEPVRAEAPEISVVIPTHNVAEYVDELLLSVRSAVGVGLEIVIVDDGSDDGTWDIVRRHAADDPRIVCVRSSGKGGGWARNDGVRLARGEYLAFADGDDVVPPNAYAGMLAAARRTDAEVVTGGYRKFPARGRWDPNRAYDYRVGIDAVSLAGQPSLIGHRACWNRLIKRDFWLEHALEFPSVPRSNDIAPITSVLVAARRITVVPEVVYLYRERPGTGSMTAKRGTVTSICSYLDQEARCAAMVGQLADPGVTATYWWTFLGRDGNAHLREYLASYAPDDAHDEVSRRLAGLLASAPDEQVARLLPVQRGFYALVELGRVDLAAALVQSERDRTLSVAETAAILHTVPGSRMIDRETLSRLLWQLVVRRLVSIPAQGEDAEALLTIARELAPDALPASVPGSAEERVAAVIDHGEASDLAHVLEPVSTDRPTLRLRFRSARLDGQVPARGLLRLVAVDSGKPEGQRARVPLGTLRVTGERWQATLAPGDLPKPGTWELVLEYEDAWGLRRQVLQPRASALPFRLGGFARFARPAAGSSGVRLRLSLPRRLAKAVLRRVR